MCCSCITLLYSSNVFSLEKTLFLHQQISAEPLTFVLLYFIPTVDNYTLPGLVCTDNDLAFLQRMRNIKQYGELQVVHVNMNSISDPKELFLSPLPFLSSRR